MKPAGASAGLTSAHSRTGLSTRLNVLIVAYLFRCFVSCIDLLNQYAQTIRSKQTTNNCKHSLMGKRPTSAARPEQHQDSTELCTTTEVFTPAARRRLRSVLTISIRTILKSRVSNPGAIAYFHFNIEVFHGNGARQIFGNP